ncbi:MAG: T9SS type A sorting domain-containing protein [Kordia sp.]|uniref:T9SS type A sorting domain-containing protein n=1 Tax=Kordia sp. TaxID=1965332 RepID=UPI0038595219
MRPLIFFFFISYTALGQLSIVGDNYIFVEDNFIFVTDNVNLQQADSKLYLRNDAQLLQGTGTTGNLGSGQLSVYQRGTTHNYAYNYWCSPVGNNLTSGNENFRANLIDDATGLLTSNDVTFINYDGTSSPLVIASYWIYTFENSEFYSDWVYRGDIGTIAPGLGFTMKGTSGSSNSQLYDFRGKPNNGTITNTVMADVWTLIGNPYPSSLDAMAFIHDTDNSAAITGTLYYWEQDLTVFSHYIADYVGGYATYTINSAGTVETFIPATFDTYNSDGSLNTVGSSSTSGKQAQRYIPVGQGFMVEGSNPTTGIVRTTNAHREYYPQSGAQSVFFRNADSNANAFTETITDYHTVPNDYKRFRLNIDFNDLYTRQLVQTFHDTEATINFDYGLESKSPNDVANDAYWIVENEPFIAQALPLDINTTKIPIIFKLETQQNLRVRIADIQHFDDNQPVFLHDKETDSYANLRNNFFEINLPQGIYNTRFEIVFVNDSALSVSEFENDDVLLYQDNYSNLLNILNPNYKEVISVTIYDLLGKKIIANEYKGVKSSYTINTKGLSTGTYIVHVFAEQKWITKKIIIK